MQLFGAPVPGQIDPELDWHEHVSGEGLSQAK